MGIDLIENSEMSALAPSRLGNKCFINDDDDDYANGNGKIFGIKVRGKKWDDKQRAKEVEKKGEWTIDPAKVNDCDYLQTRLTLLQNTIEGRVGSASRKYRTEAETRVLRGYETDYKNRVASLKCAEKKLAQEQDAQVKKNVDLAKQIADTPIGNLLPEEATAPKSNATKYILIGVGGLVVVITAIALLKRKN